MSLQGCIPTLDRHQNKHRVKTWIGHCKRKHQPSPWSCQHQLQHMHAFSRLCLRLLIVMHPYATPTKHEQSNQMTTYVSVTVTQDVLDQTQNNNYRSLSWVDFLEVMFVCVCACDSKPICQLDQIGWHNAYEHECGVFLSGRVPPSTPPVLHRPGTWGPETRRRGQVSWLVGVCVARQHKHTTLTLNLTLTLTFPDLNRTALQSTAREAYPIPNHNHNPGPGLSIRV